MKCAVAIFIGTILVCINSSMASPIIDTTTSTTPSSATDRERRQVKPESSNAQPEVKTIGAMMGRQIGAMLPFGAGNPQLGRYGGAFMPGAYPTMGFQGFSMAAPIVNPINGLGGYNNPALGGSYMGGGLPFAVNPTDLYGNYLYNGFMPAAPQAPQPVAALQNPQNLDNLTNLSSYQGVLNSAVAPAQLNPLQLQAQPSQLQPQVVPYALMPGYMPSFQGYGSTYQAYQL